jgi:hypothetical protein
MIIHFSLCYNRTLLRSIVHYLATVCSSCWILYVMIEINRKKALSVKGSAEAFDIFTSLFSVRCHNFSFEAFLDCIFYRFSLINIRELQN